MGDDAGFTEAGLVCGACVRDSLARDAMQREVAADTRDLATFALNVVGLGLALGVGRGFVIDAPTAGERHAAALLRAAEATDARKRSELERQRRAEGRVIHLRRGAVERGPFTVEELRRLWDAGHVHPADLYWYPSLGEWRSVTEFTPPT